MNLILFLLNLVILGFLSFSSAFLCFLIGSSYFSAQTIEHPLSMLAVGVVTAMFFMRPVSSLLKRGIYWAGFKEEPESFSRLRELTSTLLFERELVSAANLLVNSLSEELELKTSALFLTDGGRLYPVAFYGRSIEELKGFHLTAKSPLVRTLTRRPEGLKGLGPKEPAPQNMDSLEGELHKLQAAYVFPVMHGKEIFGILSIGFKGAHDPSRQEIRFVRSLLPLLAAAFYKGVEIENLKRRVSDFSNLQSELLQSTKLSALEQLASGVAHEIHNPLTIISGKAQVLLLKKSKNFDPQLVEEVLNTIVRQTKRASDVTRRLMMFTKSSGREKEWVDLEAVLKDTLSLISYQMSLDQMRLEREISCSLPKFWGNGTEVREIFMNLILNAIQATPGKGRIRIGLRMNAIGNRVEFCVEDSGKGISKEDMQRIFEPFYSSANENVGLGLYITERLVFKNGGKIRAESEVGKGSLFMVELPFSHEVDKEEAEQPSAVSEAV